MFNNAIHCASFKKVLLFKSCTQLHTTDLDDGYDWNKINLKSVTEENTLDEFLATAEMAGTEFTAGKWWGRFLSEWGGEMF